MALRLLRLAAVARAANQETLFVVFYVAWTNQRRAGFAAEKCTYLLDAASYVHQNPTLADLRHYASSETKSAPPEPPRAPKWRTHGQALRRLEWGD